MPADVNRAIKTMAVLFGEGSDPFGKHPQTVAEVWNAVAAKFPDVYAFAVVNKAVREHEARLCDLLGVSKSELARLFEVRMSGDNSETLEAALKDWWNDESRED